jgi:hypothetical protein
MVRAMQGPHQAGLMVYLWLAKSWSSVAALTAAGLALLPLHACPYLSILPLLRD